MNAPRLRDYLHQCDGEKKSSPSDQAIVLAGKLAAIQVQNLTQSQ